MKCTTFHLKKETPEQTVMMRVIPTLIKHDSNNHHMLKVLT